MFKRILVLISFLTVLTGCAAYQYGYDSAAYEGKLVNLNSEWGMKRLNQITEFDNSAKSLISIGYTPEYLYEVSNDDFYFMSSKGSYHLARSLLETDSEIIKVTVIPHFIQSKFDQFGIVLDTVSPEENSNKPTASTVRTPPKTTSVSTVKPELGPIQVQNQSQSDKSHPAVKPSAQSEPTHSAQTPNPILNESKAVPKTAYAPSIPLTTSHNKKPPAPNVATTESDNTTDISTPPQITNTIASKEARTAKLSAIQLYDKYNRAVQKIVAATVDDEGNVIELAYGSGVMITPNNMVTNHHVIEGHNFIVTRDIVNSEDFTEWQVIRDDKKSDLAILYSSQNHPHVQKYIRLKNIKIGQKVYAIGSPEALENTLSEGIVSGKRESGGEWMIQTTADITYGSSGGALFSETGALLGITSSGLEGSGNLNFAIPMDSVIRLINSKP